MVFRREFRRFLKNITDTVFSAGHLILNKLKSNFILLIILALLIVFAGSLIKAIFIILAFYVLGSVSLFYNRWVKMSLGFEFITFATVFTGMLYGPIAGAIVGFLSLTTAEIISARFTGSTIISLAAIAFIGAIAQNFVNWDIRYAGLLLAFIYDLIIIPLYILTGSHPIRSLLFMATHLLWNAWVFFVLAPPLWRLLIPT